jgi:rod shape-determining protein MreC
VTLINDPASTVIGEIVGSKATGEVVGDLGGTLVMDKIDATQQITLGNEVVTAGISLGEAVRSPYPKGLIIGRIVDVARDPNAVVQTAFIEAAVDLERLEVVLVITDYEGGIPGSDQLPTDDLNPDGTLPDSEQPFATQAPTPRPTKRP